MATNEPVEKSGDGRDEREQRGFGREWESMQMDMMWILLHVFFALPTDGYRDANLDKYCRDQLGKDYATNVPPKNEVAPGQPLNVYVKFKVIDIDEIHEADMDFRLHMYFKTFWNDTRLRRNESLTTDCSSYVWTPDVMFESAKTVHSFDTVSTSFHVHPSGTVIMTDRYSIKSTCVMNFRQYPFDTQECLFYVTFMTTFDDVALLKWFDDESSPYNGSAIEFLRPIELLQYYLDVPSTHNRTVQLSYANYTYLVANFTLVRRLTGSVVSIYLPSSLVVAVSWVTFWLRPEAAPARVSLSVTSLLTLCTQVQQYKSQLPSVNYITAMDVWLFVCIFEVFATLLEFAICYNACLPTKAKKAKEAEQPKSLSSSRETKLNAWPEEVREGSAVASFGSRLKDAVSGFNFRMDDGHRMDALCRRYFPLSFVLFAVVYWTYNLSV